MTEFSGRTTQHSHKFDGWQDHPITDTKSVAKVTVLDAQWSDCPVEVEAEVKKLWRDYELGNDRYIFKFDIEEYAEDYPLITKWLRMNNVDDSETVWIHWWW